MKTSHDDNTLILYLAGRIDANNAADIEAEIAEVLAKNPGDVPVFDAGELEYISSAGLRVLLKFRKQFEKNLDVLNASSEVYDIFEVTGFTELLNVKKRLREISLEGCEVIGRGAFSTVYRLDSETIVKVFDKHNSPLATVEADRRISREVFLHDIPTAISYDVVKAGEYYGLVYEMIDADTLSAALRKHPERLEELSVKTAKLLKKLHAAKFERSVFPDARNRFRMMIQKPFDEGLITSEEKAIAEGIIDRIPYRNTFVHTDFHPKNIMVSGDDLILIDVGDAGLGHPILDLALSYTHFFALALYSENLGSNIHERIIGLDCKTLVKMWNIMMPEYFGTSDKNTLNTYEEVMKSYSSIIILYIAALDKKRIPPEDRIRSAMTRLREAADTLKPIEGI